MELRQQLLGRYCRLWLPDLGHPCHPAYCSPLLACEYRALARSALLSPIVNNSRTISQKKDVTSYVIARTLGDPTASTSHKSSFAQADPSKSDPQIADAAAILVTAPTPPHREGAAPTSAASAIAEPAVAAAATTADTAAGIERTASYFVDGECEDDSGAARLAGVGVFSPVASMPGSPTLSRRRSFLGEEESASGSVMPAPESESELGHERVASGGSSGADGGGGGAESTSGESSFTLLEREESFEDPAAAAVHMRRRVPGPAGAGADVYD